MYIGDTTHHLSMRVSEHLFTDKNSHICKHLETLTSCKNACSESCFVLLDLASTFHNLENEEALHVTATL